MNDNDYETLIRKLTQLEIQHKKELTEIIDRHNVERGDLITLIDNSVDVSPTKAQKAMAVVRHTKRKNQPRPNSKYTDKLGSPLAVGDTVVLLTTASVGTRGDLAEVAFFSGRYTHVTLVKNGDSTKRYSSNLELHQTESE